MFLSPIAKFTNIKGTGWECDADW